MTSREAGREDDMGETCRAEYKRPGARDSSLHDRIVRCQLDAGHEGDHEEVDTGNRWPDMELFNRLVDANDADIKSRGELLASRDRRIGELEAKLAEAERELGHYKRVVNGSIPDHLMGRHDKQPGEQCLMCQRNALADENVRLKDELRRWRERPCLDENMNGLECHLQAGHWPDRPHEYVPRSAAVSSGQASAAGTGETGPDVNYPCPECGYEGPHTINAATGTTLAECGSCYVEFEIPTADSRAGQAGQEVGRG